MVYKRYAKKNGKVYGPYLYESYREDGVVKKRYIGANSPLENASSAHPKFPLIPVLAGVAVIAILAGLFYSQLTGKVSLDMQESYSFNEVVSGTLHLTIDEGDSIQKDTSINLVLSKDGGVVAQATKTFEEFLGSQAGYTEVSGESVCINVSVPIVEESCVNETIPGTTEEVCHDEETVDENNETIIQQVCVNETSSDVVNFVCTNQTVGENVVENCTSSVGYYYQTPGAYSGEMEDFFVYTLDSAGDYVLTFSIPSLNVSSGKILTVEEPEVPVEETNATNKTQVPLGVSGLTACGTISSSGNYVLDNDVSSAGDCFKISASDVLLDCNGKKISALGSGGTAVNISRAGNITVRNCNISYAGSTGRGFWLEFVNDSVITGNTMNTIYGADVGNSLRISIVSNNITSYYGIMDYSANQNVSVVNNRISTSGSTSCFAIRFASTNNTNITGNIINTVCVGSSTPVVLEGVYGSSIVSNNINASSSSGTAFGLSLQGSFFDVKNNYVSVPATATSSNTALNIYDASSSRIEGNALVSSQASVSASTAGIRFPFGAQIVNLTVLNNEIIANGSLAYGMYFDDAALINSTFRGNNVTSGNSTALYFQATGIIRVNTTIFENNLLNSGKSSWLILSSGVGIQANFTNTTFMNFNGSLYAVNPFWANRSALAINGTGLGIGNNTLYVNSSLLPELNRSSQVILTGLGFSNPEPIVDFEDDGSYVACNVPQCTPISYSGGTFIFNVSSFTTYSAQEGGPLPPAPVNISSCGTISTDGNYTLNESLTSTGTCLTISASNVTIDCGGKNITFGTGGGDSVSGIVIAGTIPSRKANVVISNCTIRKTSTSGSYGAGVRLNYADYAVISDINISVNGSALNYGIYMENNNLDTLITRNTIQVKNAGGGNVGIYNVPSVTPGQRTTITYNVIYSNSSLGGGNHGIEQNTGSTTYIAYNNITTYGATSGSNEGIYLTSSSDVNISYNKIATIGSYGGAGVSSTSTSVEVFSNNITTVGAGVSVSSGGPAVIGSNYVTASGNVGYGIDLRGTGSITNNVVRTSSTYGSIGIIAYQNNIPIIGNNITTSGWDAHGIWLGAPYTGASVLGNIINSSGDGLFIEDSTMTAFAGNNISITNMINGKPVYYYGGAGSSPACPTNVDGLIAGHITLVNCTGATLRNADSEDAIHLVGTNNSVVQNATVTHGKYGIRLINSENDSITSNNFTTTGIYQNYGIYLYGSSGNRILGNNIISNSTYTSASSTSENHGIYGYLSSLSNEVTGNNISAGGRYGRNRGIYLGSGSAYWVITSNRIFTSSGSTSYGNEGVYASSGYNNITYNNIYTNGSTLNYGVYLDSGGPAGQVVYANNITTGGTGINNYGVLAGSVGSLLDSNRISTFGAGNGIGIYISASGNITSNTIRTNGSVGGNYGIDVMAGATVVYNNIVVASGNTGGNRGIYLGSGSGTNVTGNVISTSGGTAANWGIGIGSGTGHVVSYNNVSAGGNTNTNYGISVSTSSNNVSYNIVKTAGTADNYGISVVGTGNKISHNIVSTSSISNDWAILLNGASLNIFDNNTLESANLTLLRVTASSNNILSNFTFRTNGTIFTTDGSSSGNNLSNMLIDFPQYGGIRIINLTTIPASTIVNITDFNVTASKAYLNSSRHSFLNRSAQITFYNIMGYTNPLPTVSLDDGPTFSICSSPRCVVQNYSVSNGTFVFNVSSFTTYGVQEGPAGGCGVIDSSTILGEDVSSNGTCFNITVSDVTLDCDNYRILYNADGSNNAFGIFAEGLTNITVKNCVIVDINSSGTGGHGIKFLTVNNGSVLSSSIYTNGTSAGCGLNLTSSTNISVLNSLISTGASGGGNYGIIISGGSRYTLVGNNITTKGAGSSNTGIYAGSSLADVSIMDNIINTTGASSGHGIMIYGDSSGARIVHNTITSGDRGIVSADSAFVNITDNIVGTAASSSGFGIYVYSSSSDVLVGNNTVDTGYSGGASNIGIFISALYHITVDGNRITTRGTDSNYGLEFQNAPNSTITNNTIRVYGSATANYGLYILGSSGRNITVINNTIATNGTTTNNGIMLDSSRNYFANNNVSTFGVSGAGIYLSSSSQNNTFVNTLLDNPLSWIETGTSVIANFTNTTFLAQNASIRFASNFTINSSAASFFSITRTNLNISYNYSYINSTALRFLNTTAEITFQGINFANPMPYVDFSDTGNFAQCDAPKCNVLSYNATDGTFVFNVSSFTTYRAQEGEVPITCGDVSASIVLANNVSANGTCFNVTASNVVIDCNGSAIVYNLDGSDGAAGVVALDKQNVTVMNCVIQDRNAGGALGNAINFTYVDAGFVFNNTIYTNGTNYNAGVYLLYTNLTRVLSNRMFSYSSDYINYGVYAEGSNHNLISSNNITTNGTTGDMGVYVYADCTNDTIFSNNISMNGQSSLYGIQVYAYYSVNVTSNDVTVNNANAGSSYGIYLYYNDGSYVIDNDVYVNGTTNNHGIYLTYDPNSVLNSNRVFVAGTSGYAIYIDSFSNGCFLDNNQFSAPGSSSAAINLDGVGTTTLTNTLINESYDWIYSACGGANDFTNTTFLTENGSINFPEMFESNGCDYVYRTVGYSGLDISSNLSYLDSNALSFMNMSAVITLFGINLTNPMPYVDFSDTDNFAQCNSPQCTNLSYNATTEVFVFNVSSFSSYRAQEAPTPVVCGAVSSDIVLTEDVTSNSTCFNVTGNDLTIDCNGSRILFGANGSSNVNGILAVGRTNITIKNCIIVDVNASGSYGVGINFSSTVSSFVFNNSIYTNGTTYNHGMALSARSNYTVLENNTFVARGTGDLNYGFLFANSSNNNFTGNIVRTTGTGLNGHGIYTVGASNNNILDSNNVSAGSSGAPIMVEGSSNRILNNNLSAPASFNAIFLTGNSLSCIVTGNRINSGYGGVNVYGGSHNISYNNISVTGAGASYAVYLGSSSNIIAYNNLSSPGASATNAVVQMVTASSSNTIVGNRISAGSSARAVRMVTSSSSNKIIGNIILAPSQAVFVWNSNSNNITGNNITITGSGEGIMTTGSSSTEVGYNNITIAGSSASRGIYLNSSSGSLVVGNNISLSGTANSYGMLVNVSSNNNYFDSNSVTVVAASTNGEWASRGSTNNIVIDLNLVRTGAVISLVDNNGAYIRGLLPSEAASLGNVSGHASIGRFFNITNASSSSALVLNVSYSESDFSVLNESRIRIWRYSSGWENSSFSAPYGVDTANNVAYANITSFSIFGLFVEKSSQTAILNFDPASPITYGTLENVTCNGELFRNNVNVTDEIGQNVILGVGSYNYSCRLYENVTHMYDDDNGTFVVGQAAPSLALTILPSASVTVGAETNATGSGCPAQLNCTLYRDGIGVNNSDVATLAVGSYDYVYNTTGNENYTAASVSAALTVNAAGGGGGGGGCTVSSWAPSPSTVCQGVDFTQTSNCGTTRTATGTDEGTWTCGDWGDCAGDMQSRDCVSSCSLTRTETRTCECTPDWECTAFGRCVGGFETRECTDKNDCGTDEGRPDERRGCGGCEPHYACNDWSGCSYGNVMKDVLSGKIDYEGTKERFCKDTSGCGLDFIDYMNCTSDVAIDLERGSVCGSDTLTVVNRETRVPITTIDVDSWNAQRLDLSFIQRKVQYCPYCYNGIKDYDETRIDCGGSCRECRPESTFPAWLITQILLIIAALLMIPVLKMNREDEDIIAEIRSTIKSGEKSLSRKDRRTAEMGFRNVKWLYIQLQKKNSKHLIFPEIKAYHRKIGKFAEYL